MQILRFWKATPITHEYLDVIEREVGRQEYWNGLYETIQELLDKEGVWWIVYNGYEDPWDDTTEHRFTPVEVIDQMFDKAWQTEDICWIAPKNQ